MKPFWKIVWLIILVLFAAFCVCVAWGQPMPNETPPQPDVVVAFTPPADPIVAGVYLYYGTNSGVYTKRIDCGMVGSVNVFGLSPGFYYYFACTTYTLAGAESQLSAEIRWAYTQQIITNRDFQVWNGNTLMLSTNNPPWNQAWFAMSNNQLIRLSSPTQRFRSNKLMVMTTLRATNIYKYDIRP